MAVRIIDRSEVNGEVVKKVCNCRIGAVTFNKVPGQPQDRFRAGYLAAVPVPLKNAAGLSVSDPFLPLVRVICIIGLPS